MATSLREIKWDIYFKKKGRGVKNDENVTRTILAAIIISSYSCQVLVFHSSKNKIIEIDLHHHSIFPLSFMFLKTFSKSIDIVPNIDF